MLLWPKLPDRRYNSRLLLLLLAGLLVPVVIVAAIVLWPRGGSGAGALGTLAPAANTSTAVASQTLVVTTNVPGNPSFGGGQTPTATYTPGLTPTGTITLTPTPTIAAPIPVLSVTPASVSIHI